MNSMPDDRPAVVVPGGSEQGESARIQTLRDYRILDSPPERAFDDIALLASLACRTPIALITFIDAEREWCKAAVGMDAAEWPRDTSFGAHTVEGSSLLRISDATKDPRFAKLPLVAVEPHVRFYAGVPLLAPNGLAVGTLCVMDTKPRRLTHDQEEALRALAGQAVAQLETRRKPNGDNLGKFFEFALDMFCIAGFDGYFKMTLTGTPSANSFLKSWSGAGSGFPTRTVTPTGGNEGVTATFKLRPQLSLSVNRSYSGKFTATGTYVKVSNPSTTCNPSGAGGTCTYTYPNDTTKVTLSPAGASAINCTEFKGWSGACTNTLGSCPIDMTAAKSVTAMFGKKSGCIPQ
jgi:hypothetical protein